MRILHHEVWPVARPIVGMIHLPPLPGAPGWGGSMATVLERALADHAALAAGGADGVLVENYGDVPFRPGSVGRETVAAMAVVVAEVVRAARGRPVGVNVLRNDAAAALAVAAATGGAFIRVNVHAGALLTDQGWVRGRAHDTLRLRARLGARIAILADVLVKHAVAPAGLTIDAAARDLWHRGLADALIVSGPATGAATDGADLRAVAGAVPGAPVWIGSGLTTGNAAELLPLADGAIVGSALQRDGIAGRGVETERVRALVRAAGAAPPRAHGDVAPD
jgi:membrane complex biogenesis BtpA family protein